MFAKKSKGLDERKEGQNGKFCPEVIHSLRLEYDIALLFKMRKGKETYTRNLSGKQRA